MSRGYGVVELDYAVIIWGDCDDSLIGAHCEGITALRSKLVCKNGIVLARPTALPLVILFTFGDQTTRGGNAFDTRRRTNRAIASRPSDADTRVNRR